MFVSFFPMPRLFFWSALLWTMVCIAFWYAGGQGLGAHIGLPPADPGAPPIIGASVFWSPPFLWFYIYYAIAVALFAVFWLFFAPHRYWQWSILGSAFIVFATAFGVQVTVAINNWRGPFWDLVQAAVSKSRPVTQSEFAERFLEFAGIASFSVAAFVVTRFFTSHYVFRWRTAMNEYYMTNWSTVRFVEGAAQRVQDDTMRFSTTTEELGVDLVDSILTLIAFLPILLQLEASITALPIVGAIPHPLVTAAIVWSLFGTGLLAFVGIKLPGLQFNNQRVEAAYRKELVYGEDDPGRAQAPTVRELFAGVRRNYFRMYFHYMYFNVARRIYGQTDVIFPHIILVPTLVAGTITLGPFQQILGAFGQVRESFQYLVSSWAKIIELLSIHKRLRQLDAVIAERDTASGKTDKPGMAPQGA